ncbi:MAG: C39 family peptidase [Tetrasphaera sp.]
MPFVPQSIRDRLAAEERAKFAQAIGKTGDPGGSLPASYSIGGKQHPQETNYWCGPAAVESALDHLGIGSSQSALATQLNTTQAAGTGWTGWVPIN